jgi:hypothetical protein
MRSFALGIVLLVALAPALAYQDEGSQPLPKVSLVLPPGVVSETVQIVYFMVGPFGGNGLALKMEKDRPSYDIDASVDGKQATNIKVIAYLPGCEIATFDIPVRGKSLERQVPCKPLGSISLQGQIFPVSTTQEQPTEVDVNYLAVWSHKFFGICDGPVTTIHLGTAVLDENGGFSTKLPDFSKQVDLGEGVFEFILRQAHGGNIIAFLKPEESISPYGGLKVQSSYSAVVTLIAERK